MWICEGCQGSVGTLQGSPHAPSLFFQLWLPALFCSGRPSMASAGMGNLLRAGPVQSAQRVRAKAKGMVRLGPLVGGSEEVERA